MAAKAVHWHPDAATVSARVNALAEAFKLFRKGFFEKLGPTHQGGNSGLSLNPGLLTESVERYFEDLEKERFENRCGLLNGYRQAAFTLKWLMRMRPIQTHLAHADFLQANEHFAMSVALSMLEVSPDKIDPYFFDFFTYTLRYDPLDEGLLMSICVQMNPTLHKMHAAAAAA